MDKRQKVHIVLGTLAFIVGGLLTRVKAIEAAETLEVKYLGMEPLPKSESDDQQ